MLRLFRSLLWLLLLYRRQLPPRASSATFLSVSSPNSVAGLIQLTESQYRAGRVRGAQDWVGESAKRRVYRVRVVVERGWESENEFGYPPSSADCAWRFGSGEWTRDEGDACQTAGKEASRSQRRKEERDDARADEGVSSAG